MSRTAHHHPHLEDTQRYLPAEARTRYALPTRELRPYLTFERIARHDGMPEAVFNEPDNTRYSLPASHVRRAFQDEMEAALAGDLHFTLPHFQLAQHGFRNSRVDRVIRCLFG